MTRTESAQKIREYIKDRRPGGISLEVVEEDIQKIDDWWRVPVRPSAWPKRWYAYYEDLAELEEALQSEEHMKVLIATGQPLTDKVA